MMKNMSMWNICMFISLTPISKTCIVYIIYFNIFISENECILIYHNNITKSNTLVVNYLNYIIY